jgi:polyhydroxyalkanoate synthesis regulator phasin
VGVEERITEMLKRHAELTDDVTRLESSVEEQRKELEKQHSNRFGVIYDEIDNDIEITQSMVDEENKQIRTLEQQIESLQLTVEFS